MLLSSQNRIVLLRHQNSDWLYASGTILPRFCWCGIFLFHWFVVYIWFVVFYFSFSGSFCICSCWCNCHSLSLASVKSRLVLPFSYRLTWVVLEKGPLNGCVCVCVCFSGSFSSIHCWCISDCCFLFSFSSSTAILRSWLGKMCSKWPILCHYRNLNSVVFLFGRGLSGGGRTFSERS